MRKEKITPIFTITPSLNARFNIKTGEYERFDTWFSVKGNLKKHLPLLKICDKSKESCVWHSNAKLSSNYLLFKNSESEDEWVKQILKADTVKEFWTKTRVVNPL